MDVKSPLNPDLAPDFVEIPEGSIPVTDEIETSENPPFSPEEQALKTAIAAQFAALTDREMLETILHNQVSIRGTLERMDQMAARFEGVKPSDILKQMMGKKG